MQLYHEICMNPSAKDGRRRKGESVMFGFGKETVYLGYSLAELSKVRSILDNHGIRNTYHVINLNGRFIGIGRGTTRFNFGFGVESDYERQYEVLVDKKDYEKAKYLLRE